MPYSDYLASLEKFGMNLGLDRITYLLDKLGDPHSKLRSIHIAGTNGKGSTAAMIASILKEAGYRVGLYTSPHLFDYRERIKVNGKDVALNPFATNILGDTIWAMITSLRLDEKPTKVEIELSE